MRLLIDFKLEDTESKQAFLKTLHRLCVEYRSRNMLATAKLFDIF